MSDYDTRFAGLRRLYGDARYVLLRELHICVVGLGGVGSWAVEALARSGVGHLTLIDYDEVCASNVNRQSHAISAAFGRKKVAVLAERVREINPDIDCHVIDDFLTDRNYRDYLERGYDYVIDAIDSISFKALMIYDCKRNKIPIITTGGAGGRRDPTRIRIVDLSRTCNDALAAKVRKALRDRHQFTRNPKRYFGVECVFSDEQPVYPKSDGTVCQAKPGVHGVHLDCSMGYGAMTAVTATFGLVAAGRAIDKALERRLRATASGEALPAADVEVMPS